MIYIDHRWRLSQDPIASDLLRYRDQNGQDWADIIEHADDASGRAAEGGAGAQRD
jgi:hypothetical protein